MRLPLSRFGCSQVRQILSALLPLLLFLGLPADAVAQPKSDTGGQSLQLSEVIESVRRSYPLIVAALADKRAAEGELQAARGGFDPVLKTRGDITPIGAYPNGRFEIGVEQPTPLWGAQLFAGYRVSVGD
ncbi:MAG TPA: hypothetical protein PKO07_18200, partial [Pseudomonadota bacterium]|nr:hypothetical protein [Pseudomonadota bacterium]